MQKDKILNCSIIDILIITAVTTKTAIVALSNRENSTASATANAITIISAVSNFAPQQSQLYDFSYKSREVKIFARIFDEFIIHHSNHDNNESIFSI